MRALLVATGKPLAAPSANRSGAISPTRAEHVATSLGDAVPLILDDGACPAGLESTIVMDGRVLRPGPVSAGQVEAVLHPGEGRGSVSGRIAPGPRPSPGWNSVTAPGQLDSHYAPSKPLRLNAERADADEWLVGFGPVAGDDTLSPNGDLMEAAARLFAALHCADASPKPRIAVAPVPDWGIGEAINDRLRRAAF